MPHIKRLIPLLMLSILLVGCNLNSLASTPTPAAAQVTPGAPGPLIPPTLTALPPLPVPTAPEYLVVLVVDGARPDYFDLANLPNFRLLVERGVTFSGAWVGALENNTPPGHAEISTGTFPRRNGIQGHYWLDAEARNRIEPTTDEAVRNGEMAAIIDRSNVPTLARLIKQRFPDGVVATVSTKAYAAQALGAGPADLILYGQFVDEGPLPEYILPGATDIYPLAVGGEPADDLLLDARLNWKIQGPGDDNGFVLNTARVLVERLRPRALLLNLPETDSLGHGSDWTPAASLPVMQATDRYLGDLIVAYRAAGIFERTLWVITSDHGMGVKQRVLIMDEVAAAAGIEARDRPAFYLPDMRLRDPERAQPVAERIAAAGLDGIRAVYYRTQNVGEYTYAPAGPTAAALPPDLNQAYLYLLNTYAADTSANVMVFPVEGVAFGKEASLNGGTHSEVTWTIQHIPLVFSGPGVATGQVSDAPGRLVDVLPTIARLMELPAADFDGVALSDALAEPGEDDLAQTRAALNALIPLRNALRDTAD